MIETDRYARQILHWGAEKQRIIEESSLLIAGVGGLGATVSQLLVRAGIGRLYLVDDGCLDWPDLNRQTLYGEKDIGRAKLPLAKERLNQINAETEIVELQGRIDDTFQVPLPDSAYTATGPQIVAHSSQEGFPLDTCCNVACD